MDANPCEKESAMGNATAGLVQSPLLPIIHNHLHALHHGCMEMFRGQLVPCVEVPEWVDHVLAELRQRGWGAAVQQPDAFDDALLAQVHAPPYLDFLRGAWAEWLALDPANAALDVLPSYWPAPGMRRDVLPESFAARLGMYCFDSGSPLTAGTWAAAREGAACAWTAAQRVAGGKRAAFALTRPPGHHAGADFFGGYCFLNNAAVAAQALRNAGAARVAVLDVDYHHGNGTQAIFYNDPRVAYFSSHESGIYPHSGAPYERGVGNVFNALLPPGSGGFRFQNTWADELLPALDDFRPQLLLISAGFDAHMRDPLADLMLETEDFGWLTRQLREVAERHAGGRIVSMLEGGYDLDALRECTVVHVEALR